MVLPGFNWMPDIFTHFGQNLYSEKQMNNQNCMAEIHRFRPILGHNNGTTKTLIPERNLDFRLKVLWLHLRRKKSARGRLCGPWFFTSANLVMTWPPNSPHVSGLYLAMIMSIAASGPSGIGATVDFGCVHRRRWPFVAHIRVHLSSMPNICRGRTGYKTHGS
jgi:hypothetical protein